MSVLEAVGLRKAYGNQVAVDGLHLRVDEGQIMALLGSNGAGKTTVLNMFMGFVTPTSGRAIVGGTDVRGDPRLARSRLGYLPENLALYPHLTGLENLRYFNELTATGRRTDAELRSWLDKVDLPPAASDRKLSTYSKGMRQKVGLALALCRQVSALILDEPLSGLDPKASNDLTMLLRRLAEDGVAVLMATHDIFRAKAVAHRVGIMRDGRMVADLGSAELTVAGLEERYLAELNA
ncbi:MAG TPA: ABC transporter ATP-binding protein [Anaeromyxobacteraceae bacterium]|nr:ABC transporter ATP-binding protein [Anaeromyxobacteraceae bacterium]